MTDEWIITSLSGAFSPSKTDQKIDVSHQSAQNFLDFVECGHQFHCDGQSENELGIQVVETALVLGFLQRPPSCHEHVLDVLDE